MTDNNFVFYFEVDEPSSEVRVLATFFGGADHRRQIMQRLTARRRFPPYPGRLISNRVSGVIRA